MSIAQISFHLIHLAASQSHYTIFKTMFSLQKKSVFTLEFLKADVVVSNHQT